MGESPVVPPSSAPPPVTPSELVALVDIEGRVVGSATRARMRAENLRHAATAVILRDSAGRIFVHRRSPTKDWAASYHDAASGGVLQFGEHPAPAARRELAEELGVTGVVLTPLLELLYEDERIRGYLHAYAATYDGPVAFADGEVVWGAWLTLDELADHLADPTWLFVPDTRAVLTELARRGVHDYARLRLVDPEEPRQEAG